MAGRYLLDTNIAVEVLRGDETLWNRLRTEPELFLTVVVLGELYYGAAKSARPEENTARVNELATRMTILSCDHETSLLYGQLKGRLKGTGRLIPTNDVWIAASAIQHDLTIVTRDEHFGFVEDLRKESW